MFNIMEAALTGVPMSRPNERVITFGDGRADRWKSISEPSRSLQVPGLVEAFCGETLNTPWALPFVSWSSLIAHNASLELSSPGPHLAGTVKPCCSRFC